MFNDWEDWCDWVIEGRECIAVRDVIEKLGELFFGGFSDDQIECYVKWRRAKLITSEGEVACLRDWLKSEGYNV